VGARPNKMSKDESEFFTTKLGWIISPSWKEAKSLEPTILYNDSQHNNIRSGLLGNGGRCLQFTNRRCFQIRKNKTLECFTCSQIILIFVLYCSNTGEHPHTDSDRFCLNCRHFCPGSLKTVASKTHVRQNTPPKTPWSSTNCFWEKAMLLPKIWGSVANLANFRQKVKKTDDRDQERPLSGESHKVTLLFRVTTFRMEMNTIQNMCPIWKAHLWCIHTWC
jgi:hypothetical protein